jgi:hypothetical protein
MNKYLLRLAAFLIFTLAFASPHISYASDEIFPFEGLPKDVRGIVIKYVAADFIAAGKRFNELEDVNRKNRRWKSELREFVNQGMQPWQPCWRAYLGVIPANEQIYKTFFNATLECRKDPKDKEPAHILPFIPLMNLSVKAFNLPADIEASKYLVITDKLQRFFEVGGSKGHILFATKAMITMRMKSMNVSDKLKAKLDEIMANWDESVAPVGIFWRWSDNGDLTWFDYLVTQDLTAISSVNIFENCKKSDRGGLWPTSCDAVMRMFHVCFEPKLELQTIGRGK